MDFYIIFFIIKRFFKHIINKANIFLFGIFNNLSSKNKIAYGK